MAQTLSKEKTDLFETMAPGKAVLKLSLPTVIGCLVMVFYNLADTFFVGMLNDPVETSAVTFIAPLILLFNAVNNLFGVGTASLMSRSLGAKDYDKVKKTSAFGLYAAILSGLLFSVIAIIAKDPILRILGSTSSDRYATVEYMKWTVFCGAAPSILNVVMSNMVRSEGSSMDATIGTAGGCLLNMILDPFFILPRFLGMGAAGAGLATFLSNTAACAYYFIYIARKKGQTFLCLDPRLAVPEKAVVKEVFGVGVPSAVQNILNVTGMTILNNFMAAYGTEAVSAMGISHKLALIPMYFSMGIAQGVMPLIGYNYASGNKKRIRQVLRITLLSSGVILMSLVAVAVIFPGSIMTMFMENPKVVEYGSYFLRAQCLATPFFALDFLAVGIFQSCGLGRNALIFAVSRKILLEIPAIIILDKILPMYGIAYAQLCAEVILAAAAAVMIRKIIRD